MNREFLKEQAPVLALAASQLVENPEFAMPLLEASVGRLLVFKYRKHRDDDLTPISEAIESGRKICIFNRGEFGDHLALAHLLSKGEKLGDALEQIKQVIILDGEKVDYLKFQASVLERMGKLNEAEATILRAMKLNPEGKGVLSDRERIGAAVTKSLKARRDQEGDVQIALALAQEIMKREPDSAEDLFQLANLLARAGDHRAALKQIEDLIAKNGEQVGYLELKTTLCEKIGKYRRAYQTISKIKEIEPSANYLANNNSRILLKYYSTILFNFWKEEF
jgi:tetratricopeptide (TPR) repeat protein